MIIGWNFGDGHLNGKHLLRAIQPQCHFEPGELRVLSIESTPSHKHAWEWEVWDAADGLVTSGETKLGPLKDEPPWPSGRFAEAIDRGAVSEAS